MSPPIEWTILEKLLLTQAVHKYGENMWFQVARVLKQNELLRQQDLKRPSDFYNQKNCSHQYYLLVEHLEEEKQASLQEMLNDIPVVVRLARQLYTERVEEIKSKMNKQQQEFNQLAVEINAIKSGEWNEQLNNSKNVIKRTISDPINDVPTETLKKQRLDVVVSQEDQVKSTAILSSGHSTKK